VEPGKRRRLSVALAILGAAVPVAGIAYLAHAFSEASREHQQWEARRGQEDLDRQLTALRSGQANRVWLYDTRGTDALLRQLEGIAEVEEVVIELTDVSEVGMASAATLPRLRKLVLYGGRGITDRGLAKLGGMSSLEVLELKNTRVANDGLRLLRDLPNLRSLAVYCEPRLGVLNDAGLVHLKDLPKLEALTLTGGWASREGVAELQTLLPNCRVFTEPGSDSATAGN
jgi:hypothetical protein